MKIEDEDSRGLLGEARAIHLAFQHRAITYKEAKLRTKPLLDILNSRIKTISNKYKVRPKYIKFYDLGKMI